ncbi:hypothetical protein F4821DRAFT_239557 [Hypoxylon rubiginosum]|uniref:Uncharacterized protein n=1 Tax=Hypoxylon rubiginosum TaxID=110542 RepID=A0ACC0CZV3_9PEZI|nr:hypothetical protein F4821DRAFT_239557 [Hypoxylon rubiginosum]
MQFKSVPLALLGVTGLMAHPFNERDVAKTGSWVEVDRMPASDGKGNLVFLGPGSKGSTKRADTSLIEERADDTCRDPDQVPPDCSAENTARNDICDQLVSERYCCVSWRTPMFGLHKGDLAETADKIMQECTNDGISGRKGKIYVLKGVCNDVCLSSRGTGC